MHLVSKNSQKIVVNTRLNLSIKNCRGENVKHDASWFTKRTSHSADNYVVFKAIKTLRGGIPIPSDHMNIFSNEFILLLLRSTGQNMKLEKQ
jgi:hypothetical protein